jgi:hypothetical protein
VRPLHEINDEAMRLLVREMGAADAARFISQFTTGSGNYTEERKELFEGLTLEEAVCEINSMRDESRNPSP